MDPQVGAIFPRDDAYPVPQQPGGVGTAVTNMPQAGVVPQGVPEMVAGVPQIPMGLWIFGCGHWTNTIDVRRAAVGGVPSSIFCCPLCSYVARIVTPADSIMDDANFILQV